MWASPYRLSRGGSERNPRCGKKSEAGGGRTKGHERYGISGPQKPLLAANKKNKRKTNFILVYGSGLRTLTVLDNTTPFNIPIY